MKISNIFKKKDKELLGVNHPDLRQQIEPAFVCKGVQYYRMKAEMEMPYGRYKWVNAFLNELEMRMTVTMLNQYLDTILKELDGKGGEISLTRITVLIHKMKTRAALGFDPELAKNLATVVYFDDTEDLTTYDRDKAKKKRADWDSDDQYTFFLTRPMDELLGLKGISIPSLEAYILQTSDLLKALTLGQEKASQENS